MDRSLAAIVSRGCASNCNSSESAVPIRARPKSIAKIGFITRRSLQLGRKFPDQILDLFGLMTMANQNCVTGPHDNEVVNSKQRDRCPVLIENDVISGIDGRVRPVPGLPLFVFL